MNKLKEKINFYKNNIFYIICLIVFLFFGMLIKFEYATDTYLDFSTQPKIIFNHFLSCGRIITAICIAVVYKLKFSEHMIYIMSYFIGIISMIFSIYIMYKILKKYLENDIISMIISTLLILNIFSIELFMFLEKGIIVLSVLMSILAIQQLVNYFEDNKKRYLIYSFIYMMIAYMCYQGTVGIFVAIGMVLILRFSKSIKQFIKNNIIVALIYGIPAIINYLFINYLFPNSRTGGEVIISESVKKIIDSTKTMILTSYNLFPKYLFLTFVVITICYIIFKIIFNKNILKAKIIKILEVIYVILGNIVVTILPQFMQNTASIWFVSRSTYTFATLFAILLLYIVLNFKINKKEIYVLIGISLIFLFIQYNYFIKIEKDRYTNNYIDNMIAQNVVSKINEYEQSTGKYINKIALYKDKNSGYTYSGIFATGDMNIKTFSNSWSANAIINYFLGRNLELIAPNKEKEADFSERDWNYYNEEQVVLEGDTLHLCVY